jgi:hypothetical protein
MSDTPEQLEALFANASTAMRERRYDDVDRALDAAAAIDPQLRLDLLDLLDADAATRPARAPGAAEIEMLAALPMFDPRPWTEVLAEGRKAAGVKRSEVVAGLGERFAIADPEGLDLLEERYHELESGQLDPARVQPALRDALGDLLGGIRETLAATRLNPLPELGPDAVVARSTTEHMALQTDALMDAAARPPSAEERRIDELFGVDA